MPKFRRRHGHLFQNLYMLIFAGNGARMNADKRRFLMEIGIKTEDLMGGLIFSILASGSYDAKIQYKCRRKEKHGHFCSGTNAGAQGEIENPSRPGKLERKRVAEESGIASRKASFHQSWRDCAVMRKYVK